MKASLTFKNDVFVNGLFLLGMFFYFISMFIPSLRVGIALAFYLIMGLIIAIRDGIIKIDGIVDILVICYLFYNLLSIFISVFNGFPLSVPIREFANSIVPITLYFIGNNSKNSNKFYNNVYFASLFCIVIGVILYIKVPLFYREYLLRIKAVGGTDPMYARERMCSIIGSTSVGTFSVFGLIVSLKHFIENKKIKSIFACGICLMGVFLSFQRSAYLVAFGVIFLAHYYCFFKWNILKKQWMLFEIFVLMIMGGVIYKLYPAILNNILERIIAFKDAFGGRTNQWFITMENTRNIVLGNGLGSVGHTAIGYSKYLITDGGLIKIFCESGIFGFSIFAMIVILSMFKCLSSMKRHYVELAIILTVLIQSLGSNTISFMMEAIVFWYAIGAVNKNNNTEILLNSKKFS